MRLGPLEIRRAEKRAPAAPDLPKIAGESRDPLALVLDATCRSFNLPLRDLVGPSRRAELAHARHVGMWVAREVTSASLPEIGRRFGGRDHTTVLYGIRKVQGLLAHKVFAAQITSLRTEIEAALWREAGAA